MPVADEPAAPAALRAALRATATKRFDKVLAYETASDASDDERQRPPLSVCAAYLNFEEMPDLLRRGHDEKVIQDEIVRRVATVA